MVSTFTPNINLEEPARGDQVGTWDTPVNNNTTIEDLIVGGSVFISGTAGSLVLSAAQFQAASITFNSTLLASMTVTFPSTFKKGYTVRHLCTGSSAFTITLQTTVAGSGGVACRPGNAFSVFNDGTNVYFVNLGTEVGGYWDYAGSSVPNWVSACTVPPYLNCDGSAFSSAVYPQLATILGGTTLPDSKGRARFALDQGAGRISSGTGGFAGSSALSGGGGMTTTLLTSNLPTFTPTGTFGSTMLTPSNAVPFNAQRTDGTATGLVGPGGGASPIVMSTIAGTITLNSVGNSQAFTNLPPAYIGGLTLIRAA